MPDLRYIPHHQSMIEFDASAREALFVIKKTAENLVDLKRPEPPFLGFECDPIKNLWVMDKRRARIPDPKKVFL
jgi:hypothetical protein